MRDLHIGDVLETVIWTIEPAAAPDFVQENMMRLLRKSLSASLVLATVAVALAPTPVLAHDTVRIDGTFTMSYIYSAVDYCAPGGGDVSFEAQGIGSISGLGPMLLTVKKCYRFADGIYAGIFKMTAGNGDTLTGTYAGTQSAGDENGFGPFQGTLTITGGTGRFRHARGGLNFEAVSSPDSVGVTALTGMAFYLVQGNMVSPERH